MFEIIGIIVVWLLGLGASFGISFFIAPRFIADNLGEIIRSAKEDVQPDQNGFYMMNLTDKMKDLRSRMNEVYVAMLRINIADQGQLNDMRVEMREKIQEFFPSGYPL